VGAQFNKAPGVPPSFTLDSHGEEVYLFSAGADGNLTGYSHGFQFGAAASGVSFGRYTNSVGEISYPPQLAVTRATANAGPIIGPIVINEIMYGPATGADEFIELKNISTRAVKLYDPDHPINTWKLAGVDFRFPQGVEIPAGGVVVISGIEPGIFRDHAQLPPQVQVYGPFSGNLQDNGELLELQRPDAPDLAADGTPIVPYVAVDTVRYGVRSPWPQNSAATGSSIERINAAAFGNDPANWRSSP
jgi:hypothetical protein